MVIRTRRLDSLAATILGALALMLASAGLAIGASAAAASTVTKTSKGVTASMVVGTHNPKVNKPWPLKFTVTKGGKGVKASVSYEYLYGGKVVAKRSHYTFTGHFSDTFYWPADAVGEPLTFRAVITSGKALIYLDYAIKVVK